MAIWGLPAVYPQVVEMNMEIVLSLTLPNELLPAQVDEMLQAAAKSAGSYVQMAGVPQVDDQFEIVVGYGTALLYRSE